MPAGRNAGRQALPERLQVAAPRGQRDELFQSRLIIDRVQLGFQLTRLFPEAGDQDSDDRLPFPLVLALARPLVS